MRDPFKRAPDPRNRTLTSRLTDEQLRAALRTFVVRATTYSLAQPTKAVMVRVEQENNRLLLRVYELAQRPGTNAKGEAYPVAYRQLNSILLPLKEGPLVLRLLERAARCGVRCSGSDLLLTTYFQQFKREVITADDLPEDATFFDDAERRYQELNPVQGPQPSPSVEEPVTIQEAQQEKA
jgi:hypothetical protein